MSAWDHGCVKVTYKDRLSRTTSSRDGRECEWSPLLTNSLYRVIACGAAKWVPILVEVDHFFHVVVEVALIVKSCGRTFGGAFHALWGAAEPHLCRDLLSMTVEFSSGEVQPIKVALNWVGGRYKSGAFGLIG